MFDGTEYPKSLEEEQFDKWLEKGRASKISYSFLLVIWNAIESEYEPVYIEDRRQIEAYDRYPYALGQEALVAVYDLYSEARIALLNE